MSTVATWPLEEALYTRLESAPRTSGYTWARDYPQGDIGYGQVGPMFGEALPITCDNAAEIVVQLDYWGDTPQEVGEAMEAAAVVLGEGALILAPPYHVAGTPFLSGFQMLKEADGERWIRHGVARFRFLVTRKAVSALTTETGAALTTEAGDRIIL